MSLSVITPPIGNARWTPQKIRKFSVVWIFILQIWRNKHVCTNTIGIVNVHILNIQWETGLVLLAKIRSASPIRRDNAYLYKAVATGNRNNELYRETARSNWKQPSIGTMPDYSRITVFIMTPLIFRYNLPLKNYAVYSLLINTSVTIPIAPLSFYLSGHNGYLSFFRQPGMTSLHCIPKRPQTVAASP